MSFAFGILVGVLFCIAFDLIYVSINERGDETYYCRNCEFSARTYGKHAKYMIHQIEMDHVDRCHPGRARQTNYL